MAPATSQQVMLRFFIAGALLAVACMLAWFAVLLMLDERRRSFYG